MLKFSSLRLQLLSSLFVPLILIVSVDIFIAYDNARTAANLVTDRTLFGSAKSIGEQIRDDAGSIEAVIPPAAIEMFESSYHDIGYYRVISPEGSLLQGYPEIPEPPALPADGRPVYYNATYRNADLRLVAMTQPIPSTARMRDALVIVGETLHGHDALVRTFYLQTALQQVGLVAVTFILTWFILKNNLRPLLRLGHDVAMREPNQFAPIPLASVHDELRPFVIALNQYMGRLAEQLETRKRFTANAAHQLRTPLTLLRTQAEYALREATGEQKAVAGAIIATSRQMTRLTNQLLVLSRAEAQQPPLHRDVVDLVATVRAAVEEFVDLALAHSIDLSLDVEDDANVVTLGERVLMHEMVVNLVDNAIRYTPPGGSVSASVYSADGCCVVQIRDSGPGIAPADRRLWFERFFRGRGVDSEGSGLGLAIVKEIVDGAGGEVNIEDTRGLGGSSVVVKLPPAVTA